MRLVTAFLLAACALAQTGNSPWTKQPIETQPAASVGGDRQIKLKLNRSTVIDFKPGFQRVSVTNGDIAEAVAVSSVELLLNGKSVGDTSLIIWDKGGKRTAFEVQVMTDNPLDVVRAELRREVGDEVTMDVQGTSVFLRGRVKDIYSADRAAAIAGTVGKVVNLLNVAVPPSAPQILLKVRFASLDRTLANQLGVNLFSGKYTKGSLSTQTGQFGGIPSSGTLNGTSSSFSITDLLNIFYWRPDIDMGAILQDLETKSVLQILAEPNVLALSGHTASFLAGGEFPFPTLQGGGAGVGQVTIQFRDYGIRLNFLPVVTPRGTIHLTVEPEVSALDYSNGLTVSGFTIPGLSTRRIQTEMELENGQSFVIAGLLDAQTTETFDSMPGIGNIPILGKLFQSRSVSKNKSELLILVTPEIVQPIGQGEPLPHLDLPKSYLDGELPKDWIKPVPATLPKVTSLPLEQMRVMSQENSSAPAAPTLIIDPAGAVQPGLPTLPQIQQQGQGATSK